MYAQKGMRTRRSAVRPYRRVEHGGMLGPRSEIIWPKVYFWIALRCGSAERARQAQKGRRRGRPYGGCDLGGPARVGGSKSTVCGAGILAEGGTAVDVQNSVAGRAGEATISESEADERPPTIAHGSVSGAPQRIEHEELAEKSAQRRHPGPMASSRRRRTAAGEQTVLLAPSAGTAVRPASPPGARATRSADQGTGRPRAKRVRVHHCR